jgi:hypothetical protein
MSYAYAARTVKSEIPFGQGAIAGVIAPEAANNSKEGGAMVPTLFFGIPGSSGMAIMMGALGFVGVMVGPNLLTKDIGLSYSLAAAVFLSNLVVVPMFFAVIPSLVRLSSLRREAIAPFAIVISVTAALIDTPRLLTIVLLVIGSAIGIGLKLANWPRAPFILGFVIGGMVESSYFLTVEIFGWAALTRPVTLALAILTVSWLFHVVRSRPVTHLIGPRMPTVAVSAGLGLLFLLAVLVAAATIDGPGKLAPMAIGVFGTALTALILVIALRARDAPPMEPIHHVFLFALFIALTPLIGLPVAAVGFVTAVLMAIGIGGGRALLLALTFGLLQSALLAALFDVLVEREIIGRIAWDLLGY